MFRTIISPILRSTELFLQFHLILVISRQHRRCFITQAVKKKPIAPEDGRNYRPKHVELIETVNKIIIVASSRLFILLYQ